MKIINDIWNLDKNDKIILLLIFTTLGNIILALVKFIFAFTLPSLWFFVNALFATLLSISRFFSIIDYVKRRNITDENNRKQIGYRNYFRNGVLLILLGIMYFFISVYMYYKGTNIAMHEYLIYLVALSSFWSIGWAIYGIIRYNKKINPILKAVKQTSFANALTSIVLTQIVLLDKYANECDLVNINGYTGMGVSVIIIIMGLYMVINIRKYLVDM